MRRTVTAALPALLLLARPAEAHVKWFEEFRVSTPPVPIADTLALPAFWIGMALVLAFFAATTLLERKAAGRGALRALDWPTGWLHRNADAFLLAVFGAFFVALFALGNTYLTPELETERGWVPWAQIAIAVLLVPRQTRALAGLGLVALWLLTLRDYDLFHLLDYLALGLGIAGYLVLSGLPEGARSEGPRRHRFAALRWGVALALMWSSMEKFMYPQWFQPLLEERPFLAFGLPFGPYTTMAGVAEFTLGFGLLWTPLVRRLSAAALFLLMFAAVYPFGRIDLVGHATILASLLVFVADPEREGAVAMPLLGRRTAAWVPAGLAAALAVTMASYSGMHHLIYQRAGDAFAWARTDTERAAGAAPGGFWRPQTHYHGAEGDPDRDFAAEILRARQEQADLARRYLAREGGDAALRRAAEEALRDAEEALPELRGWRPSPQASAAPSPR